MHVTKKIFLGALVVLGGGAVVTERWIVGPERTQLAAAEENRALAQARLEIARRRLATITRQQRDEEQKLAELRARLAAIEASPPKLWSMRINLLKQLLAELPRQRIPEIRLLDALDWIEIARMYELDTQDQIRTALAAARALARKHFAQHLRSALQAFTQASGGELPRDVRELAALLPPPVDSEMIERYAMTRTGRIGADDEALIKEKPGSDMTLSVRMNGWRIGGDPATLLAPGEGTFDGLDRGMRAAMPALTSDLGAAAADVGVDKLARGMSSMVNSLGQDHATGLATEPDEAFGAEFKAAIARYQSAHAGEAPANLEQLMPYFPGGERIVAFLRPMIAQVQYLTENQFNPPSREADLKPYLERPVNSELLRQIVISKDGDSWNTSYSTTSKGK